MAFRWPEGYRAAVLLTFDIDGTVGIENSAIGSLANRPALRSMVDYGPRIGVPRILSLMQDLGLPATFFVPGQIAEMYPEMVRSIVRDGHEVAHHGHRHMKPDRISLEQQVEELDLALPILRDLAGDIYGSRTPGHAASAHTMSLLRERGLIYHSGLMGHDEPYRAEPGLLELPCLWPLEDWEQWGYIPEPGWEYPMEEPEKVLRLWTEHFEAIVEVGGVVTMTLHPWVIGRPAYTRALRRVIARWRSVSGVWWPRCRDIAFHALESGQ